MEQSGLVVGARSPGTQATAARRYGNAMPNWTASYLTERPILVVLVSEQISSLRFEGRRE